MKEMISVWMGSFEDREEFSKYTFVDYTEDGDSIPSEFEKEFSLEYYDRDLMEKKYITGEPSLEDLFADFSYYETFELEGLQINDVYNSIIVIYDLEEDINNSITQENTKMVFIGKANYVKEIDNRW